MTRWLTYRAAAARVRRSTDTIKRWRRQGMPMGRDDRGRRIVDERVLLETYRAHLDAWPIHQQRQPPVPARSPERTRHASA